MMESVDIRQHCVVVIRIRSPIRGAKLESDNTLTYLLIDNYAAH